MSTDPDCVFCKIIGGEIPSDVVRETEHTVAFRDLNPQAPTHVLVIPRRHEPDIGALVAAAPDEAVAVLEDARRVAEQESPDGDYRLVFNTGPSASQTVFHCHAHVLAGRSFSWPPG